MATYNFTVYPGVNKRDRNRIKLLTGQRFGRLLVLGYAGQHTYIAMWHCLCDCGSLVCARGTSLRIKNLMSCGCYRSDETIRRNRIHGESKQTPEYQAYMRTKSCCTNPRNPKFANYGGRGIECRFNTYQDFLNCVGRRPSPKHSLDRIDVNGHYEAGNLRWATEIEQARNKQQHRYITASLLLSEWVQLTGLSHNVIRRRLSREWCTRCALMTPANQGSCIHR